MHLLDAGGSKAREEMRGEIREITCSKGPQLDLNQVS